ncbi:MAG: hypothetical protein ACLS9K_02690 [Lachnospira eligens]
MGNRWNRLDLDLRKGLILLILMVGSSGQMKQIRLGLEGIDVSEYADPFIDAKHERARHRISR